MNIKQFLAGLRKKIDSHPELKIKIMLVLDKLPIVKRVLKKMEIKHPNNDIKNYNELSKSAKDIFIRLKDEIKVEV